MVIMCVFTFAPEYIGELGQITTVIQSISHKIDGANENKA